MLRAIVFACVLCFCEFAFAQPEEFVFPPEPPDPLTVLEMKLRSARAKGDAAQAIKILRQIVMVEPEDADWRLKLAEDLLKARRIEEARREFAQALNIEPNFHEARIGVARTFAIEKKPHLAKAQMLEAARRGYRAALMMRKGELSEHFKNHQFAIDLLEADKPRIGVVRDPFVNPLPRPSKDDPRKKKEEEKKKPVLTPEEQKEIADSAVESLETGQAEIGKGNLDKALECYREIVGAYAKREAFTEKEHLDTLTETHRLAQEVLYPSIQKLFREQTLSRANTLLDKLCDAVWKRDREEAQRLNKELAGVVQKAGQAEDKELKKKMEALDKERARVYKTVEILDEYDREVAPRLALRGTITGRLASGQPQAFLDVRGAEGTHSLILTQSDKVPPFDKLRVIKIDEDVVHLRYRGVEVRMRIGAR